MIGAATTGETTNETSRLEAFSDGVLAIIITIMVLELRRPEGTDWHALKDVAPSLLAYLVSFALIGIYWNNHHHLMRAPRSVNARIMWCNLLLLFTLSLVPFFTDWVGENHADIVPTAAYGALLFLAACAYTALQYAVLHTVSSPAVLESFQRDVKGKVSAFGYLASVPIAYASVAASQLIFVAIAILWIVPDRRLESAGR